LELINRYVHAVTERLPQGQRAEIEKELRGLIEDMLEERTAGEPASKSDVEQVLLELGRPSEMANRYRGGNRYLISPERFDMYVVVLKVVSACILISLCATFAIQSIVTPGNVQEHMVEFIVSIFTAGLQGFAWVTLAFFILDYAGVKADGVKKEWKPSDLPPVLEPKMRIKLSDPIISIIFIVIFLVLVYSSDWIGVIRITQGDTTTILPVFEKVGLHRWLPLIYGLCFLSVLKECVKLAAGRWSKKLALGIVALNVVTFIMAAFIFTDSAIWNPDFMSGLNETGILTVGSDEYNMVQAIWDNVTRYLLIVIAFGFILDTGSTLRKAYSIKNPFEIQKL
jgi:hypothetical protein